MSWEAVRLLPIRQLKQFDTSDLDPQFRNSSRGPPSPPHRLVQTTGPLASRMRFGESLARR